MPHQSPRVLLVLPELPQNPASGAARSLTSICEILAAAGFSVHCLAVTATELAGKLDIRKHLKALGIGSPMPRPSHRQLVFTSKGIDFRLLEVGKHTPVTWDRVHGARFDLLFDDELKNFQPDIVFTYGGSDRERQRRSRAREHGAKLVFGLRNDAYLSGHLDNVDVFLTPSRYLSNLYREVLGIESTPLPPPMELEQVLAENHEPIFLTMVNPSAEKGVTVFARLAEELSRQRPDLPILVIESRGTAGLLGSVALAGGFDLRRHENIMVSSAVPQPRDIYTPTRILAVPSLRREAAGRVVQEALLNGIPPIVSDRGGLAENCASAGFVMKLPESLTQFEKFPVAPEVVRPWVDLVVRLFDDEEFYQAECRKAREAGRRYLPEALAPLYVEFFRNVLDGRA
jgi:glycosyltransferase involved in cell wall biosynthesis